MSATISPCGKYRYTLHRTVGGGTTRACVVMVNPSTADATENDATIRKLIGFGKVLGWSEFTVVNLFAYRATDIHHVHDAVEPIGRNNNEHILIAINQADIVVFAWGASGKLPPRLRDRWKHIDCIAFACGKKPYCLGTCKDGHPRHPVMLPYSTPLTPWEAPNA